MIYDVSQPAALMAALLPDLLLMAGAMALALLAAWRWWTSSSSWPRWAPSR